MTFTLTFPGPRLFRPKLRLSESWIRFGPDSEQLSAAYGNLPNAPVDTFSESGQRVEDTVGEWLTLESQTNQAVPSCLPNKCRGRCQPTRVVNQPICSPLRKARNGDFEPADEILTFSAKRVGKQIRRIQSLLQRFKKEPDPHLRHPAFYRGYIDEWLCILKATVFATSFSAWISNQPELGLPPFPLPTHAWLWDLLQLVKQQFGIILARDRKNFIQKAKLARLLDEKHMGSQKAFAQVRGTPRAPVNQVIKQFQCKPKTTRVANSQQVQLEHPQVDAFQFATPVSICDMVGTICARASGQITLQLPALPIERPTEVQISQQCLLNEPRDVAHELTEYWGPLRRSEAPPLDTNSALLEEVLQKLPTQDPVEVNLTFEELSKAIKRLKANSARGVDGISAAELKILPQNLLYPHACTYLSLE